MTIMSPSNPSKHQILLNILATEKIDSDEDGYSSGWNLEELNTLFNETCFTILSDVGGERDAEFISRFWSARVSNPRLGLLGWKVADLSAIATEARAYLGISQDPTIAPPGSLFYEIIKRFGDQDGALGRDIRAAQERKDAESGKKITSPS